MKTETNGRAKRLGVVASGVVLVCLLSMTQEERVTTVGAVATTSAVSALPASSGPVTDALETMEVTSEERPATLPADATIVAVEEIPWGNGTLEVAAGEVLVRFHPALSESGRNRLIAQLGSSILEEDTRLGFVRVSVPDGGSVASFQQVLSRTEGVVSARPDAIMKGAANRCNLAGQYYGYQWHLNRLGHSTACATQTQDPSATIVAVLDTGVAYENYGAYVQASDLANVPIVSPYDFVNNDAHPNDDHQHGTHVSSVILGLGKTSGVTPAASLMPVKVLDASNRGKESWLAQGLDWAVANNAKVINMSLSFPEGYTPSGILQQAVSNAANAGVLMIASSGNNGVEGLPYPAAFREVLTVGATRMKRMANGDVVDELASYSNRFGADLVAPGGSLAHDADLNGYPDGILGQTIRLNNPGSTSYFFYSGTSQAAAVASGVATWLVAAGATPAQARDAMLQTATDLGDPGFDETYGHGQVNLQGALAFIQGQLPMTSPTLYANILPAVKKSGGNEYAVAQIKVLRSNGAAVANAKVLGRWNGSTASSFIAMTNAAGIATVTSPSTPDDSDGSIWGVEVTTIVDSASGRRSKPKEAYYMSQGLAALLTGLLDEEATQDALVAFEIIPSDTTFSSLFGAGLARSYTVKSIGPTLGTPGIGITFTPDFIAGLEDDSMAHADLTINFGQPQGFGDGTASSSLVKVYNNGVGLMSMSFSRGVGMLAMNFSRGIGFSALSMNRFGGVGLSAMSMAAIRGDSAIFTGEVVGGTSELVLNEDPASFLASNGNLGVDVAVSLSDTRCAANSADVNGLEAIMVANSVEEGDALLDSELGASADFIEFTDEPISGLITEE